MGGLAEARGPSGTCSGLGSRGPPGPTGFLGAGAGCVGASRILPGREGSGAEVMCYLEISTSQPDSCRE